MLRFDCIQSFSWLYLLSLFCSQFLSITLYLFPFFEHIFGFSVLLPSVKSLPGQPYWAVSPMTMRFQVSVEQFFFFFFSPPFTSLTTWFCLLPFVSSWLHPTLWHLSWVHQALDNYLWWKRALDDYCLREFYIPKSCRIANFYLFLDGKACSQHISWETSCNVSQEGCLCLLPILPILRLWLCVDPSIAH